MKWMLGILISMSLIGTGSALGQSAGVSYGTSPVTPAEAVATSVSAPAQYGRSGLPYGRRTAELRDLIGTLQQDTTPVFVVPEAETSVAELLAANEDMTVMTRIFSRALQQANLGDRGGNPFGSTLRLQFAGQGTAPAPSIYLKGYGALFTLNVDFPLAPSRADDETAPPETQPEGDPLWQQMRADVFEPGRSEQASDPFDEKAPQYSAEKVEILKNTLIGALKHAANIRGLAPDEVVVVTVLGTTVPGQVHSIKSVPGSNEFEFVDNQGRGRITAERLPDVALSAPTVLMIRATSSSISSFAKGQSNLEQFREKVRVLAYPHLGRMRDSDPILPSSTGRSRR